MLVAEAGAEVEEMRKELRATMGGGKAEHKSYTSANGYGNSALPAPSAFDPDSPDDDAFGAFEQQRQAEIMHEQDEAIDGVFKTVGNLRQQADDMGRELEEQVELLEDVNQLTDRVQGKIQNGIRKVGWVIKNTEGVYNTYRPKCPKAGEKVLAYPDYRNLVKLLHWRACLRVDTTTHPRLDPLMLRLPPKAALVSGFTSSSIYRVLPLCTSTLKDVCSSSYTRALARILMNFAATILWYTHFSSASLLLIQKQNEGLSESKWAKQLEQTPLENPIIARLNLTSRSISGERVKPLSPAISKENRHGIASLIQHSWTTINSGLGIGVFSGRALSHWR